jgi:hypothetical protein
VRVTCTPHDGGASGAPVTDTITISDSPPTQPTVTLAPDAPATTDDITVTAQGSTDADGDAVTYRYEWTKNGTGVPALDGQTTVPSAETVSGETWTCTVTPVAGGVDGPSASDTVTVGNTPPAIVGVDLTPDPASGSDDLLATPSGWADADGAPEGYQWRWEIDSGSGFSVIAGETTDTLASGNFAKGDTVRVTCTPFDGTEAGAPVSDTVTITDRAPTQPVVAIAPEAPLTTDDLTANASGSTDPDGETVTFGYRWDRDGVHQPDLDGRETVPAANTSSGETWTCTVTPSAGGSDGPSAQISVTVGNTAPTVASVEISPDPAATDDDLTATAEGWNDPDGDAAGYDWLWEVNGGSGWAVAGDNSSTLAASEFARDDQVRVTCTPNDGVEAGPAMQDSVTIVNTPPTVPLVDVTPDDPATTADLIADVSGSSDIDDDTVTFSYRWLKNGEHQPALDNAASVPAAATSAGETWRCEVTPSDGTDTGAMAWDEVTVGGVAPQVDAVAIGPDPALTTDDLTATPSGWTDPDGDPEGYLWRWHVDSGSGWIVASTDASAADGPTLSCDQFSAGDRVRVTCTPWDGTLEGAPVTDEIEISNSAPGAPQECTIDPGEPSPDDDLVASVSGAQDADGDALVYECQWRASTDRGATWGEWGHDGATLGVGLTRVGGG